MTDYWNMLSEIIIEEQQLRYEKKISQKELSKKMGTRQSVISRFENMGRKPNYDFLVRMAHELGCNPKMYLDGDFSVQVPYELREKLLEIVNQKEVNIEQYLIDCITVAIEKETVKISKEIQPSCESCKHKTTVGYRCVECDNYNKWELKGVNK